MARKTINRKKSQTGVQKTQKATRTSTYAADTSNDRWTCAFDSDDHNLAVVRTGVNGHTLRIVDVQTGAQRSEYTATDGARIRSVAWGQQGAQALVALGLQSGSVQLYSPARNAVVRSMQGSSGHQGPVVSVAFVGTSIFGLDEAGTVVQWDAATGTALQTLRTKVDSAQRLLVAGDATRVVVASHRMEMWDVARQSRLQAWPGHTAPVHSLMWAADETALVSAAEGDRHVHVWDASPRAGQSAAHARAVLAIDSDAMSIDVARSGSVLAVGADGTLSAWHEVAVAQQQSQQQKQAGRNDIGYAADGRLRIVATTDSERLLSILLARFSRVAGDEGNVLVVRGSSLRPLFETLPLADEHGHFSSDMVVERAPQDNMLMEKKGVVSKMDTQYTESGTSVTTPALEGVRAAQRAAEQSDATPTLADRVKQLSVEPATAAATITASAAATPTTPSNPSAKPTAGSLVRVLIQALHTSDSVMLDSVLDNSARTNVVRDTVLGLPLPYVLPLIQQLFLRFHATPARAHQLLPWIRTTLALHSAHLITVPGLVTQLAGLYQGIEARLDSHQRLLRLSGRLELANAQIRARSHFEKEKTKQEKNAQKQTAMKPINVYREEEEELLDEENALEPPTPVWQAEESTDDEDDDMGEHAGKDGAEDNQWTDGDNDSDSDSDTGSKSGPGSDSDSDSGSDNDEDLETYD
ncbi:Small subunit (SSU) processome component [Kickxella alabastrina]|uniref:Small subunit (SSU) processome component n=1 Tax=Kickxella alabastrina TaxID=61397 RepID=A0ACC1IVQ0_9FUNG|nr:Small subunit (SSU) processome component [Kickxella alabastrina]